VPEPPVADPARAASLRDALDGAEFTVERVEAALGAGELSTAPADVAVHALRLTGDDAFTTLARLFLLGLPLASAVVDEAIAPITVDDLAALGVAEATAGAVRATVRLVPHGDYYVASDLAGDSLADASTDWVPGVQAPSVTLAKLAVRRRAAAALDVGTGCGIQALLAAKHCDRVVATDVNPRALRFAMFNAVLNGVESIHVREGDLFAPVDGERFDLIVANPPYVISPDASHLYRDAGLVGDEVSRRVVREAPEHLAEGGFAHVLVSWAHEPDGDWSEPLRRWVDGVGCDAWLLHYKSDDPLTHAASWLGPLARDRVDAYREGLERWQRYLRELGIDAIGYGAVVLRRRSGANWIRTDEIPFDRLESASDHTLRVFAAAELLGDALLDETLVLVDSHRLEQTLVLRDGRAELEAQTLELADGLRFRAGLDRYSSPLVRALSSPRPVREAIAAGADELGVPEAERERYAAAALEVVRRLLELGFLVRP
jgi:methylase of polypeptide subunit release factors